MNNNLIYCKYLKKYAPKQNYQIFSNKIGKRLYEEISQEAWEIWLKKQTKIINEQKLNMTILQDRKKLEKHMLNFFFGK
ncbi:oxidative damage protection protein [Candidatus Tachikawaea gelatinosa]|nr:oxidative damage protection protein [Candidatus Tachikawaea gelatinosa]